MMKIKMASLLLVCLVFTLASFCQTVAAAQVETPETYNKRVNDKIAYLEDKYLIKVTYPSTDGYAPIGTATLATLDSALEYATPTVVRQVSRYYYHQNGQRLHFSFAFSEKLGGLRSDPVLAGFDDKRSLIEIYIPAPNTEAMVTGCSPTALVHEFAHALHLMCADLYGVEKMQAEWTALNQGIAYSDSYISLNPNDQVFATGYAATKYAEDVAETIAYAFVFNRAGLGLGSRLQDNSGNKTALGRKIAYIEALIPKCLDNTEAALSNIRKIYEAPGFINYKHARLSGSYLEFIGFNQPNRVLGAMLNALDLNEASCTVNWVVEIGGWDIVDANGNEYILFPGGTWGQLVKASSTESKAS